MRNFNFMYAYYVHFLDPERIVRNRDRKVLLFLGLLFRVYDWIRYKNNITLCECHLSLLASAYIEDQMSKL